MLRIFFISPGILGGANCVFERVGGSGFNRIDKFVGESGRIFWADDDGVSGASNAYIQRGAFVSGGESLLVRDHDAGGGGGETARTCPSIEK